MSSPYTIKHWVDKGFTEEQAKIEISKRRPSNYLYWMEKGLSEKEAKQKVFEHQSAGGTLLKRKIIQGKSFLEVVHEGGSAQDTAFLLKQIVLNEMDQRNMLKLRFAGRKTSTKSADTDLIAENDAV